MPEALIPTSKTIEAHGCSVALSRVDGPLARELFIHCRPRGAGGDAERQAVAAYRAIAAVLESEGGTLGSSVFETVFLGNVPEDIGRVRAARGRVLTAGGSSSHGPATLEIAQAPLADEARLEVSVHALIPFGSRLRTTRIAVPPHCGCAECALSHGLLVHLEDERRFHAAGLCAPGDDAYRQTLGMFERAEELLACAGMTFADVVRTWIHLRHIGRDYDALNRARREFFRARRIDPAPASTGIGGGPVSGSHDLCLTLYAVKPAHPLPRAVMTTPTLNEASDYGADFVRGMRVEDSNKVALFVSGTASIDEGGRTVHQDDVGAQTDRMLVNIAALLRGQGAGTGDVVHAITYLKHPGDAERVRARLADSGFQGFPHAFVVSPICRPELLCETEVLAVRPLPEP